MPSAWSRITRQRTNSLLSLEGAGGTLPKELDQKHQALLEQLSKLSGDEFDQQYMKGQVQDHQAAVKLFASEATQPSGPVDALAGELLPALQGAPADGGGDK